MVRVGRTKGVFPKSRGQIEYLNRKDAFRKGGLSVIPVASHEFNSAFRIWLGLNVQTLRAVIFRSLPVLGFRPRRSLFDLTENVPKLETLTFSPSTRALLHHIEGRFHDVRRFLRRKATQSFVNSIDDVGLGH